MEKLFSKEKINLGRQPELDIARGIAVLFMILIHLQEYFSNAFAAESPLGIFIDFVGGIPAAPVFMFLMGIGIVYSRKAEPKLMIQRGFMLIGAGYALNLLRGVLPNLFNASLWLSPESAQLAMDTLIYVDIFQFSGLAMIFFGIFKHFKLKDSYLVGALFLFALLNANLEPIQTNSYVISAITGLFWGSNEFSFFPFLTWIFYPITGYLFGKLLQHTSNKNRLYGIGFFSGLFIFIGGLYLCQWLHIDSMLFSETKYYHHQILDNFLALSFVLWWISALYFANHGLPSIIHTTLTRWSRNVSEIYFIHWILIGWLVLLTSYNTMSLAYYMVLTLIVFSASDGLAEVYVMKKKQRTQRV